MLLGLSPVGPAGCGGALLGPPSPEARTHAADARARAAGFTRLPARAAIGEADGLPVAAWLRPGDPADGLRVYLEGDGLAFRSRRRASDDPTPLRATALELAIADPHPGPTGYLGRPCQYAPRPRPDVCTPLVWTAARYGEAVIAATEAGLDTLRAELPGGTDVRLELFGYSGGGVVAALLAARRDDVARLVTVAAPLDVDRWTALVGVPPLAASHTPLAFLERLRAIEQVHLVGQADRRVPPEATTAYVRALGPDAPVTLVRVPERAHAGWAEDWADRVRAIGDAPASAPARTTATETETETETERSEP